MVLLIRAYVLYYIFCLWVQSPDMYVHVRPKIDDPAFFIVSQGFDALQSSTAEVKKNTTSPIAVHRMPPVAIALDIMRSFTTPKRTTTNLRQSTTLLLLRPLVK
jgi:hypothetical protein